MAEVDNLEPEQGSLGQSPKPPAFIHDLEIALVEEQRLRQQFHETRRPGERSEFINGMVVKTPPANPKHDEAAASLAALILAYVESHQLGQVGTSQTLLALARNDFEPDVCFWHRAKAAAFQPGQVLFPAPDFVAEILSDATATNDRGVKFEDYGDHGVAEYWIIDPEHESVEQYWLDGRQYHLVLKTDDAALASQAIPGFVISTRAIFDPAQRQHALHTLLT